MDISRIKNLVKQNGDKFILVENGEPELVVMSFQEYEKLFGGSGHASAEIGPSVVSAPSKGDYNAFLADWETERIKEKEIETRTAIERRSLPLPANLEDIRLEDLPI